MILYARASNSSYCLIVILAILLIVIVAFLLIVILAILIVIVAIRLIVIVAILIVGRARRRAVPRRRWRRPPPLPRRRDLTGCYYYYYYHAAAVLLLLLLLLLLLFGSLFWKTKTGKLLKLQKAKLENEKTCSQEQPMAPEDRGSLPEESYHRLPDGVRTNGVFAEVPQHTIIMT